MQCDHQLIDETTCHPITWSYLSNFIETPYFFNFNFKNLALPFQEQAGVVHPLSPSSADGPWSTWSRRRAGDFRRRPSGSENIRSAPRSRRRRSSCWRCCKTVFFSWTCPFRQMHNTLICPCNILCLVQYLWVRLGWVLLYIGTLYLCIYHNPTLRQYL